METVYKSFSHIDSYARIGEILNSMDTSFPEVDKLPDRSQLTFTNGFYINNCTALFIDIRSSSALPSKHKRPKLAKLYRVYISEMVAVMNSNYNDAEISIVGDCVSAVYHTPYEHSVQSVFGTAAQLASMTDIINHRFAKDGIQQIDVGIGIAFGRALMIKAGFKGSGINDVVWMGDVANEAAKLCSYGGKSWTDNRVMVSETVYSYLDDHDKGLLRYNTNRGCWHGSIYNITMNDWLAEIS